MNPGNYESAYNQKFDEVYTRSLGLYDLRKKENPDFTEKHLTFDFVEELHQDQNFLRYNARGNSFTPDPFIEELLEEFPKRNSLYTQNAVDLFLKHQLPKLKDKYSAIELKRPEVYNYEPGVLLEFLANYFALTKAKIDLANSLENSETEPKTEASHTLSETTYRQVLIMHYIFSALGVSDHRTKQAKLRLIQSLTGKNADKILEVLNDPFTYKGLAGQSKDLQFARKLFEDLELEGIVQKINKDLSAVTSKKNEK